MSRLSVVVCVVLLALFGLSVAQNVLDSQLWSSDGEVGLTSSFETGSTDYEDATFVATPFTVPNNRLWEIETLELSFNSDKRRGEERGTNVYYFFFNSTNGEEPGQLIDTAGVTCTVSGGVYSCDLSPPANLSEGTYYFAIVVTSGSGASIFTQGGSQDAELAWFYCGTGFTGSCIGNGVTNDGEWTNSDTNRYLPFRILGNSTIVDPSISTTTTGSGGDGNDNDDGGDNDASSYLIPFSWLLLN